MFAGMLAGIGFGNAGCHLPHGMSYAVAGLVRGYNAPGMAFQPPDGAARDFGHRQRAGGVPVYRRRRVPERHLKAAAEAMGADTLTARRLENAGNVACRPGYRYDAPNRHPQRVVAASAMTKTTSMP